MGRKKRPIFAVVAADVRSPRDGRYIEDLGRYYPLDDPARVELKDERVLHWLRVGAQPTHTVRNLLSKHGILLGLHMERKGAEEDEIVAAVGEHRERWTERAKASTKITVAQRKQMVLEAEAEAVRERESAAAEARKKAAAAKAAAKQEKAKAQAEAAEKQSDDTSGDAE